MSSAPETRGDAVAVRREAKGTEGGFAVPAVIFLLFAIGVAAAAGFQVVQGEARLSLYAADAGRALAIAQGGLRRYMAMIEQNLADTLVLEIGGGEAFVHARRVNASSFPSQVWLVTSRGVYGDPRFGAVKAERTVRQHAIRRRAPLNLLAAFANTGDINRLGDAVLSGTDGATGGQCPEAPRPAIAGSIQPTQTIGPDSILALLDAAWELLTDPDLPVDYQDVLPPSDLPSDVYPVTRFTGDHVAPGGTRRGLLIVTGQLDISSSFRWDGIILAGSLASPLGSGNFVLNGVIAAGFGGTPSNVNFTAGTIRYHSCHVLAAGDRVAMLRPISKTWMELF